MDQQHTAHHPPAVTRLTAVHPPAPHPPAPHPASAHRPRRPGWSCRACGEDWPCQRGKEELLSQYAVDRVGLLVYLAGLLVDAVQDIEAPPHLLLDRFLRWAKLGESA